MRSIGIVRKVDNLGRVVIPVEIRRILNINEQDPVEIALEDDTVTVRKYAVNDDTEFVFDKFERYIKNDLKISATTAELLLAKVAEIKDILKENTDHCHK